MTRPYIIALFLFGTAILGSLVFLHFYLMERAENETFLRAEKVLSQVIDDQYEELDLHQSWMEDYLDDPAKVRLGPLLDIYDQAESSISQYQEAINHWQLRKGDSNTLQILRINAYEKLNTTARLARRVILENRLDFDLSERNAKEKVEGIDEIVKALLPENLSLPSMSNSQRIDVETRLITAEFLSGMRRVLMEVSSLGGSKATVIDTYFPILIDGYTDIKKGEVITMHFAIGSY
ncbi:MAG: hypothetical protein AAGA62_05335, partial [Bacteroidota bacterium]